LWEVTTESKNTASSHERKITDDKIKRTESEQKIGSKTGDDHSVTVEQFRFNREGSFKIQEYENLH